MPNKLLPRDEDADNVLRLFRTEKMAHDLGYVVSSRLMAVEGFAELPRDLRERIEEQAALLYAGGYLHAVKLRD